MKPFVSFICKCIAVSASVLLFLFLLNYRYEQVMEDPYTDAHKFDYMNTVYQNIQICNIGSSHGEYGFYYEELTKKNGFECFNFAMSSQSYNYDYALLSMYKEHFADDCLMFIPVSYFSFNNEVTNEAEEQFLSTKYYTFLSPKYIPEYNPYVDFVTHIFPILSAGEDLVKIFPPLSLKAFAAEAPAGPTPEEFQQKALNRFERHFADKEEYFMQERIDNLYKILEFCQTNGMTPVLITTPYTHYYSDLVSDDYKTIFRDTIQTVSQNTGVPYYDYSEDSRFQDNLLYYADADHLNDYGAHAFMETMKKEIPEFQKFLSTVPPLHSGDSSWVPEF